MTTNTNAALRSAAKSALEALEALNGIDTETESVTIHVSDEIAALRAALTAAAQPPEGWVMVPVEATEEMKAAAVKYANGTAVYKNVSVEVLRIEEGIYGEVYEAMLAARPGGHP